MKNQKSSKTLQNGSKSTQTEANTTQKTQGKSVLFIFFENVKFRTYFVNSHTLSFPTANIEPGLPVKKSNAHTPR